MTKPLLPPFPSWLSLLMLQSLNPWIFNFWSPSKLHLSHWLACSFDRSTAKSGHPFEAPNLAALTMRLLTLSTVPHPTPGPCRSPLH
ncbi:hypothetical protein B0I35DRAFT_187152 [Stachybotrys elegans]|uniref:Uncharacterized protein n=1 Tax=Stachybotrys elegans TaxID=80388 RepID=A0A8K0SZ58_9HYPO|nr:hypothetical protein B0I35DRAFT_187152 [Stachybotrys elegans]